MDRRMSTFDKKTPGGEVPVHDQAQDTETLLLERLKNSRKVTTFGGCYLWLAFTVAYKRWKQQQRYFDASLKRATVMNKKLIVILPSAKLKQTSNILKPPSNISRPR